MTNPAAPASSLSTVEPDAGPLASARTLEGQLTKGHWATVARLIAYTTSLLELRGRLRMMFQTDADGLELVRVVVDAIERLQDECAKLARSSDGGYLVDSYHAELHTVRTQLEAAQAWKPLFVEVAKRLGFGEPDTWRPAEVVRKAGEVVEERDRAQAVTGKQIRAGVQLASTLLAQDELQSLRAKVAQMDARESWLMDLASSHMPDYGPGLVFAIEPGDDDPATPPPTPGTKAHHHLLLLEVEVERAMLRRERATYTSGSGGGRPTQALHTSEHIAHCVVQGAINDGLLVQFYQPSTMALAEIERRIASVIDGERERTAEIARCYLGNPDALTIPQPDRADAQPVADVVDGDQVEVHEAAMKALRPRLTDERGALAIAQAITDAIFTRDSQRRERASERVEPLTWEWNDTGEETGQHVKSIEGHRVATALWNGKWWTPGSGWQTAKIKIMDAAKEAAEASLRNQAVFADRTDAQSAASEPERVEADPHGLGAGWVRFYSECEHSTGEAYRHGEVWIRNEGIGGWKWWRGKHPTAQGYTVYAREAAALALGVAKTEAVDWSNVQRAARPCTGNRNTDEGVAVAILRALREYDAQRFVGGVK